MFKKSSVDTIMASFKKTIDQLNTLANTMQKEAETQQEIIDNAYEAKAQALTEGERATTIAGNLAKILEG